MFGLRGTAGGALTMFGQRMRFSSAVKTPKTSEEIKKLLQKATPGTLAVGWFSASWCGPCKSVQKHIETMAEDFKTQGVNVVKVDVDDHSDLAQEFAVSSVPTFFFLKDGKTIDTVVGANADRVKAAIEKNLSPSAAPTK